MGHETPAGSDELNEIIERSRRDVARLITTARDEVGRMVTQLSQF